MRLPDYIKPLPSAPLRRPFQLFGKGFEVKLSSPLTMSPEVVLWIATGMSFQQAFEAVSPDHGRAMKDFRRALECKNKLSSTTVGRIRQTLLPRVQTSLTQDEILSLLPAGLPWRVTSDAIRNSSGSDAAEWDLVDVIDRLAEMEALPEKARSLAAQGKALEAEALIVQEIGHPEHYWAPLHIPIASSLIVDGALQVSAYVEGKWVSKLGEAFRSTYVSPVRLLDGSRRPLGHWLVRQQQFAGCNSLGKLGERIPAESNITIDRLKDWSAGRNLMPPGAARILVDALHSPAEAEAEITRYRHARWLSFLVEFVACAAEGEAPSWFEAQAMVERRYCDLLELAIPRIS